MENLEKLEIPEIEFFKVTLLNGATSNCSDDTQDEPTTGQQGGFEKFE